MSIGELASAVWRHRISFLATLVACVAAVVAVTLQLPKTYATTATLYVGSAGVNKELAFDTNLGQQLARTYTTLASNPNVAEEVRRHLPLSLSRAELLARMSFAPVEQTQLIQLTAEGASPREAQTIANTYADVFASRVAAQLVKGTTQTRVSVSEPAAEPTGPSKPNPPLYIGAGGLLAALLALGVALLRDRLDKSIKVADEDDVVLGQPILARVPEIVRGGERGIEHRDSLRVLGLNLSVFLPKTERVLLVTSGRPVEGKSTVAASLAMAMVADGHRVALVEGDLRRPGLRATGVLEGFSRSQVGLANYLVGAATKSEIVTRGPSRGWLSVIWSGPAAPNPTRLLGTQQLKDLLDWLKADHEWVIVDAPPVSIGADASILATRVGGMLYVVDVQQTTQAEAQAGVNQLRKVSSGPLGVVLNRAAMPKASYYYAASSDRDGRVDDGEDTNGKVTHLPEAALRSAMPPPASPVSPPSRTAPTPSAAPSPSAAPPAAPPAAEALPPPPVREDSVRADRLGMPAAN